MPDHAPPIDQSASPGVATSLGSIPRHDEATLAINAAFAKLEHVLRWVNHTPMEIKAESCVVQIRSEDQGRLAMTIARIALTTPVAVIERPKTSNGRLASAEIKDLVCQLKRHRRHLGQRRPRGSQSGLQRTEPRRRLPQRWTHAGLSRTRRVY
ncbi:MAG: hypothetical protein V3V01_12280 [Acidimicrobiales bacterium]